MPGVDSGGSGLRVALARADGSAALAPLSADGPAVMGERGIDAESLFGLVRPLAERLTRAAGTGRIAAACVGAAGMASLGDDLRARLPGALRDAFGVRRLALAGDAVTAYAGALGMRAGVMVTAGTGVVALGTAADGTGWRRADGWGHLLGDAGSGAWIGRSGLDAALRAHDGRADGSAALPARAERLFGPIRTLPAQLYPRPDRPAVLASFAPEVAACAAQDAVASDILRHAAAHILESAAAARPGPGMIDVALTGGCSRWASRCWTRCATRPSGCCRVAAAGGHSHAGGRRSAGRRAARRGRAAPRRPDAARGSRAAQTRPLTERER